MQVVWSEAAERDLARIQVFLALRGGEFAARVQRALLERAGSLADHPWKGRAVAGTGVRRLSLPDIQYVLSYRPLPGVVLIVGVRHTREMRSDDDLLR